MNHTRGQFSAASGSSTAKAQLLAAELIDDAIYDLVVGLRTGALGVGHNLDRVAVELRVNGIQPQRTDLASRSIAWPLAQRGSGAVRPYSVNSAS